jgi:hypothetical protein
MIKVCITEARQTQDRRKTEARQHSAAQLEGKLNNKLIETCHPKDSATPVLFLFASKCKGRGGDREK